MCTHLCKQNQPNKVDPARSNPVAVSNLLKAYQNQQLNRQSGVPEYISHFAKDFSAMPAFVGSSVDQSGKLRSGAELTDFQPMANKTMKNIQPAAGPSKDDHEHKCNCGGTCPKCRSNADPPPAVHSPHTRQCSCIEDMARL